MKKIILTLLVYIFIGLIFYNNCFTKEQMTGTYVNNHNRHDTIKILQGYRYNSNKYGKGLYKLKFKRMNMSIELKQDNIGKLDSYVDRVMYFGDPKIHIDDDLEEYYEKIAE
ncbi:hypothetical protein [Flavobacterium sp.]|uniref:hypothetical protein n=1 Tax=Flavobacterium sp. TaxID=239 RepID=UPI0025D69CD1|nr:hypothetical protein [Flavobacterium sp.]